MRRACSCIPGNKRHFLSKNFFASQKPLLKIRFAERTCAKKEDETLLEKGFTEKEKMMREVDVEMEKEIRLTMVRYGIKRKSNQK